MVDADAARNGRRRLRVVFLTCHLPYAGWSGGRRRELELLRRTRDHVDVEVCAVTKTPDDDLAGLDEFRRDVCPATVFAAEPCRHDADLPAQVLRHCSPMATRWLASRLRDGVDLVHVEGSYLCHLLPDAADRPPLLVVEQNIESTLWRQRAAVAPTADARAEHAAEARRTAAWESAAWAAATACATVTEEDAAVMRAARPDLRVEVVPDGADLLDAGPTEPAPRDGDRPVVAYVGNFAYEPNVDAARHLVLDVLPAVRAAGADPVVWLVGNAPGAEVSALGDGDAAVLVTGAVPDVRPYLAAADVVAVPLRVGGGVKVKVLEALAAGKAVVTTPVGAQGLRSAVDAGALVVAEGAGDLGEAVAGLLADGARRRAVERAAARAARRLPTWDDAARCLLDAYAGVVAAGRPAGERAGAAR